MRVCASIGEGACDVRLGLTMAAMNKIQPVELLERNRIAVGEGMVLGYRQDIFPAEEPVKLQRTLRFRHNGYGEINPTVAKPALQLRGATVLDGDLDIGMRLAKIADQGREPPLTGSATVPTEGAGQGFVGSVPVSPRCIHK